ncbi:hypothetical protein RQP46_000383 [Phenoliferia psychrophenolica]
MSTRPRRSIALCVAVALCGLAGSASAGINLTAMDTIFAFGDSYTASGYSPLYGIHNLTGTGNTISGGKNWIQYLALNNPSTANSYYNLAFSGATVNNSIVDGVVPSFVDQALEFQQYFVPVNATAPVEVPWSAGTTLFGINDIGYSYSLSRGFPSLTNSLFPTLQPSIFDTYTNVVTALYASGARNFLFMGIPPTNRTPLVTSYGAPAQALFTTNVMNYNTQLFNFVNSMPTALPGTNAVLYDTQPFFNTVLDNFASYGFQDNDTACPGYYYTQQDPTFNNLSCPWPLSE